MLHSIRKLFAIFSPPERLRFAGVLCAMLGMGSLQMAGVGVILPFVALISDPSSVHDNAFLQFIYAFMGFESVRSFLLFTGGLLLFFLLASNAFTAFTIWLVTRFSWSVQRRTSARLLAGYLNQPYEAFVNRNSADIGKNILIESQQFSEGVLLPALQALAFAITASMIAVFLFVVNPVLAVAVLALFGVAYLLVYATIRRALLRIGGQRMVANTARFQAVSEAFGSVKEVKVMGREDRFLSRYKPAAESFASAQASAQVMSQLPRYAIEGLAFGVVLGAMVWLLASGSGIQSALPLASAFVVAGYRLLPALQSIYNGVASWRFNQSVLDTLKADLEVYEPSAPATESGSVNDLSVRPETKKPLSFSEAIELRDLTYNYPNAAKPSLMDVSLRIERNSFVALTGTTGAGKTTLADVILGLLEPSAGSICIDDVPLTTENGAAWQANLGYVPQDIYLTDSTVAGNIAYGLPPEEIDHDAVVRAAKIANIHDFILESLPEGYDSVVGERGVRLSGGQRQRIGIARAMYHDPAVIVLDEATSALDNETERRIVNELDAMRGGRTLIVIAHRLSTVEKCHKVFRLDQGRLAAQGSYDEVVLGNKAS